MKYENITVTVDDLTYRAARMKAAERDTSVSALVKRFLTDLAEEHDGYDKLEQDEKGLRERIRQFGAADRLSREALHERRG